MKPQTNSYLDTFMNEHNGDQTIDLYAIKDKSLRRRVFYDAVQAGFFHMPPFMMQRPAQDERDREYAIRIPVQCFDLTRYHLRILATNTDIRVTVKKPATVDRTSHHDLAKLWHLDRFDLKHHFSDNIVDDYFNELCPDKDSVLEFRDQDECLIGACLLGFQRDTQGNSICHAYYFYYDTSQMHMRHPGYTMLLMTLDALKTAGYDHFHPGIYKPKSDYSYKANLSPVVERYEQGRWQKLDRAERPRPSPESPYRVNITPRFELKLV